MISAVVLTKNEENNIQGCLESLKWVDEIVVVDDYSSDGTLKAIQNSKIKIFRRSLKNNFAEQRNYGLEKATGEWVLFVDADERVSPALRQEISNFQFSIFNGALFKRRDFFLGRWLKHGETASVKLLRLARKGSGEWHRRVHETWEVNPKFGQLKNPILHNPHPTISEFLESINFHTDLHCQVLFEEGKRTNLFEMICYPLGKFFLNYFWCLGFLDGIQGLMMALMMSLHSFLARAKLYAKTH